MNDKPLQLTDYQQATLTEMGITWWRKIDPEATDAAIETRNEEKPQTSMSDPSDAIAKLRQAASNQEPTKPAEQPVATSLAGKILVTVADLPSQTILTDILLALNLDSNAVAHHPNKELSAFSDYQLAWQSGDEVSFKEQVLTTPISLDASSKKALWAVLSQDEH